MDNQMSVISPKIFTTRNIEEQRLYMWRNSTFEDEINLCERRNIEHVFLKYLPKDEIILEAGCGLGGWLIKLSEIGYSIEGIDIDADVISRIKKFKPELKIVVMDVHDTKYNSETLGAYISLGVMEHFEQGPQKILSEASRILKPGGIMILTVPYNNIIRKFIYHPMRNFFMALLSYLKYNTYFSEYRYHKWEITNYVRNAKFKILEIGIDDFKSAKESMGIWADWPFLRSSKPYGLNMIGKAVSSILSFSKWISTSGIYIVAQKPDKR